MLDCFRRVPLAKVFALWVAVAAPVTVIAALIYVSMQQNYRQGANDPQIQMAEDAAAALASGTPPKDVAPKERVDMAYSLAPYMIILDDAGNPVAWSGELDGQPRRPPQGVLETARERGQFRVTWQPRRDVRIAAVVQRVSGTFPGYVVTGRSLREVECREADLTSAVFSAWLVGLTACAVAALIHGMVQAREER